MKSKTNLQDFSEMTLFIGLDVHKKQWSVAIRTDEILLKRFTHTPDPEALVSGIRQAYPGASLSFVYEAGFCGFWVYRELVQCGASCMVVHVPDIPTQDKDRKRKSDNYDSAKLAQLLQSGLLTGVSVPDHDRECDRGLVRSRDQFKTDQTRTKNRIKSILNRFGIEVPYTGWGKNMLAWLAELELHPSTRAEMDLHLAQLHSLNAAVKRLDAKIKELA